MAHAGNIKKHKIWSPYGVVYNLAEKIDIKQICSITPISSNIIYYFLKFLFIDFRDGGREREKKKTPSMCCSTYLHIHWLILVCVLTGSNPSLWGIGMMLYPTELPGQG